jgi:2-polyprenyl-3-methyl-5-hydroxy-6-metoxy-1,4-benzoquinol methylase
MAMRFIRVDVHRLKKSQGINELNSLDVYTSPRFLLREFFWLRLKILTYLISKHTTDNSRVLDFGGGSGLMLPTLSRNFKNVFLVDRKIKNAKDVVSICNLLNVSLMESDILQSEYPRGSFGAIIAADVLEHFSDVNLPITKILEWLSNDGFLFTSLPTENKFYELLRLMFKKQKPSDHFYSAKEVECFLECSGFKKVDCIYHPLFVPILPLFNISVWKK